MAHPLRGLSENHSAVPDRSNSAMTLANEAAPYDHSHDREEESPVVLDFKTSTDRELDDLLYSWKRVTDPRLRRIALDMIRSMATAAPCRSEKDRRHRVG